MAKYDPKIAALHKKLVHLKKSAKSNIEGYISDLRNIKSTKLRLHKQVLAFRQRAARQQALQI